MVVAKKGRFVKEICSGFVLKCGPDLTDACSRMKNFLKKSHN